MSTKTTPTPKDEDVPDDEISDEERELLEWTRENSERLGPIADRMLQSLDEEGASAEASNS